jgi:hypothetical protein
LLLATGRSRGPLIVGPLYDMRLPPIIELKVECPQQGDLSGLIFELLVTTGSKNPFRIHFEKTSENDTTRITAEDFCGQFNNHFDMASMDYDGSIETAADVMTIRLFDERPMMEHREELLRWPLFKHERTVWESREEFISYFLSCRNREFYFSDQSVRVPRDGVIHLIVNKSREPGQDVA